MKIVSRIIVLCCTLLMLSCSSDKKEELVNEHVIIGYLPIIAHLPSEVARLEGHFIGLDVEFKVFGSSEQLLTELWQNKINIATTVAVAPVLDAAVKFSEKGHLPVQFISLSNTTRDNPFDGVFVRKDSNIKSLIDLDRKRVGVFPGLPVFAAADTGKSAVKALFIRLYYPDIPIVKGDFLAPVGGGYFIHQRQEKLLFAFQVLKNEIYFFFYILITNAITEFGERSNSLGVFVIA